MSVCANAQAKQPQEQALHRVTAIYATLIKAASWCIASGGGDGCGHSHNTIHTNLDTGSLHKLAAALSLMNGQSWIHLCSNAKAVRR